MSISRVDVMHVVVVVVAVAVVPVTIGAGRDIRATSMAGTIPVRVVGTIGVTMAVALGKTARITKAKAKATVTTISVVAIPTDLPPGLPGSPDPPIGVSQGEPGEP